MPRGNAGILRGKVSTIGPGCQGSGGMILTFTVWEDELVVGQVQARHPA